MSANCQRCQLAIWIEDYVAIVEAFAARHPDANSEANTAKSSVQTQTRDCS